MTAAQGAITVEERSDGGPRFFPHAPGCLCCGSATSSRFPLVISAINRSTKGSKPLPSSREGSFRLAALRDFTGITNCELPGSG